MINKTIKALMTLIAISSLSSFAYAGSFGVGVSGNIASVSADGTEQKGQAEQKLKTLLDLQPQEMI